MLKDLKKKSFLKESRPGLASLLNLLTCKGLTPVFLRLLTTGSTEHSRTGFFSETSILIPEQDTDIQTQQKEDRPSYIAAKILNKIFAFPNQDRIEKIIGFDQVIFILEI